MTGKRGTVRSNTTPPKVGWIGSQRKRSLSSSVVRRRKFEPSRIETIWRHFDDLEPELQQLARDNYELLKDSFSKATTLESCHRDSYKSLNVAFQSVRDGVDSDALLEYKAMTKNWIRRSRWHA